MRTNGAPWLVLLALLLAGCSVPKDADDEDDDDGSSSDSSGIDSSSHSFLINVGGPGMGPVPASFDVRDFDVEENASLLLEARWSCASPTCTLDVILVDPEGQEIVRAPGTGEVSFLVANVTAGTYTYGIEAATEPVAQASGDVAVTAFYGSASAEGYTAFNATDDRRARPGP